MYIDTTFCSKNSHHLPSRQDSVNIVIKEIRNWFELSEFFTLLYFDVNSIIQSSITKLNEEHLKNKLFVVKDSLCKTVCIK